MSTLTDALELAAHEWRGTELDKLLQWACLHIKSQDEALAEVREEYETEERERLRLENALHVAKLSVEAALGHNPPF